MIIKTATFIKSSEKADQCPKPIKPEYAFIGRSNVGKSSLINMLVNQNKLAKTSSTPGKTQLINHFEVNENFWIVDLPGYGFARVPKTVTDKWEKMIRTYLLGRTNLMCVFVLIDTRIDPQASDLTFINWLGEQGVPLALAFTKADKQTVNKTNASVEKFKKALLDNWEELPPYFITSAEKKIGRDEMLDFISKSNKLFIS